MKDILFFVLKSICNFAGDNRISSHGKILGDILHNPDFDFKAYFKVV